jgi:integrase
VQLPNLIKHYADNHPFGFSPDYRRQLGYSVAMFSIWLQKEASTDDFSDQVLTRYVDYLRGKYAPDTARTQRGNLLTLWRHAVEWRIVESPPLRVRKLKMPPRRPIAWTPAEVATLAAEASRVLGRFPGTRIRRGPNLRALILYDWDTGFRLGDCLRTCVADVDESGKIEIVQHKTRIPAARQLRPDTVLAVACTVADDPARTLVWPMDHRTYQDWITRLRERCVVRPGTFKWIRRAVATASESQAAGGGTAILGHTSAATAVYYLDRAQLAVVIQSPPLPPTD